MLKNIFKPKIVLQKVESSESRFEKRANIRSRVTRWANDIQIKFNNKKMNAEQYNEVYKDIVFIDQRMNELKHFIDGHLDQETREPIVIEPTPLEIKGLGKTR